jgi:hypothetical protein
MPIINLSTPTINLEIVPASGSYGPLNLEIVDVSIGLSTDYGTINLTVPASPTINLEVPTTPSIELTLDVGQGPSGVIGSAYAIRVDEVSSTLIYRAEALAGSANSAAVWRIQKITISGSVITIQWADGVSTFTKVWNDRATYTYS